MREIKFRGKTITTGEWVYGYYVKARELHYILPFYNKDNFDERYHLEGTDEFGWYEVDPKTVGQFTGLLDKNGEKIYEGDIIRVRSFNYYTKDHKLDRENLYNYNQFGVVEWVSFNCSFMIMQRQNKERLTNQWNNSIGLQPNQDIHWEMEIIGDIFENPELLAEEK
jgi:uncharacterized phage protein (TIGR01671 family)